MSRLLVILALCAFGSLGEHIECGDLISDDCISEYDNAVANGSLDPFYKRCVGEGGAEPLRTRCSLCCFEHSQCCAGNIT